MLNRFRKKPSNEISATQAKCLGCGFFLSNPSLFKNVASDADDDFLDRHFA